MGRGRGRQWEEREAEEGRASARRARPWSRGRTKAGPPHLRALMKLHDELDDARLEREQRRARPEPRVLPHRERQQARVARTVAPGRERHHLGLPERPEVHCAAEHPCAAVPDLAWHEFRNGNGAQAVWHGGRGLSELADPRILNPDAQLADCQ
jgi:hypothetical protein